MKALLVAFALGMAPLQAPPPELRGRVLSETTGGALPYALVEVLGVAGGATYADSLGWYSLRNIPPGRRIVRASHVDHAALEVEVQVPATGNLSLHIQLQLQPVVMAGVRGWGVAQRGSGSDTVALPMPALGAASARALETTTPALVELGLAKAAGTGPGPGQGPVDPAAALYVRGAASDLKLMLLDGAPVYTPFHLAGLISAFEAGVLQAANLYLGGAPARYDGGLSSVLDLETRSGRRPDWHVAGGADLVSARGVVDGPLGRHATVLASSRAIHGFGAEILAGEHFPYQYLDGLVRLDVSLGSFGSISATAFQNREAVHLDGGKGTTNPGTTLQVDRTAVWGNAAGSVRYRHAIGATDAELTVAAGSFTTRLPVGSVRPWVVDGGADRLRMAADFNQLVGDGIRLQYGVTFDRLGLAYYTHSRDAEAPVWIRSEPVGEVLGAYVDTRWTLFPQVQLRGGVRLDTYSTEPGGRLAPRASVRWLLTDRAALTFAGGVFRQYMRVPLPSTAAAGGEVRWQGDHGYVMALLQEDGGISPLSVARATHLTVQLDQDLGEGVRLGLEGYYKNFDRLPEPEAPSAEASGFDIWARRTQGRLVGWAGYSLAWIWSAEGDTQSKTPQFAGRQLVSAGVSAPLAWRGSFELRVAYGTGMPYTAVSEPPVGDVALGIIDNNPLRTADAANRDAPPLMSAPEESYLRVDASLSRTWSYERGRRPPLEITPYLKVLNALDRRDALFWYVDPTGSEPRAMAALPVLPILGVEWKF